MEKFKIVIKGNDKQYKTKANIKCDSCYPLEAVTNLLMITAIDYEYDEKELFKILKQTYKELKNKKEGEE